MITFHRIKLEESQDFVFESRTSQILKHLIKCWEPIRVKYAKRITKGKYMVKSHSKMKELNFITKQKAFVSRKIQPNYLI